MVKRAILFLNVEAGQINAFIWLLMVTCVAMIGLMETGVNALHSHFMNHEDEQMAMSVIERILEKPAK